MKKKAVIISLERLVCSYIKEQLDKLLGDLVDFDAYSLEDGLAGKIACDLCLFPTEDSSSLNLIAEKLLPGTKFLSVKRTLLTGEWQKISSLPYSTKALLVNSSRKLTFEAISFLLEMGANHIEFYPYFPGAESYPKDIHIAITPDEEAFVPRSIETIVNIGPRVIDGATIFEIINVLGLMNPDTRNRLLEYVSTVMPKNIGLLTYINQLTPDSDFLKEMVYASNYIIVACDENDRIVFHIRPGRNLEDNNLLGRKFEDCFRNDAFKRSGPMFNEVLEVNGRNFLVNKITLPGKDNGRNTVYAMTEFSEIEAVVSQFRRNKSQNRSKAKYSFPDIVGNSESILKARKLAMKAAGTELDILIEGETGTGKELFANSIHNASRRKEGPFIAFNCAAISSSLLESELFGYEEGSFTGAKKGGKHGLIESAHNGTLFLDEIGEISPGIQIALLRVLQEREVIRVGGTDRIPVNIRVIAATNRNLNELVAEGSFRKDLYYRLNVLPLRIPPLRERKEDIILFISSVLRNRNLKMDISDEVIRSLSQYDWPGNIRELINCCEYVIQMEDRFSLETLPYYIRDRMSADVPKGPAVPTRDQDRLAVLAVIQDHDRNHVKSGRRTISDALQERGIHRTEGEVRSLLRGLCDDGLVEVSKGRAGTRLSEKGRNLLEVRP